MGGFCLLALGIEMVWGISSLCRTLGIKEQEVTHLIHSMKQCLKVFLLYLIHD